MAHLSLSLLGSFRLTVDGQPGKGFKSNKVRALLAYLAVEANRPHRREVLAGLLWPDWPDRDALANLRSALFDLRKAIGDRTASGDREASPPFLLITRDTLQFNAASDHQLDVAEANDIERRVEIGRRDRHGFWAREISEAPIMPARAGAVKRAGQCTTWCSAPDL